MENSVFKNLNLNDSREENESYEDYKQRRKSNKHVLKLYKKHGRNTFLEAFPDGITYADIYQTKQEIKLEEEKTFIPAEAPEPVNFNLDEQTENRIFGESK